MMALGSEDGGVFGPPLPGTKGFESYQRKMQEDIERERQEEAAKAEAAKAAKAAEAEAAEAAEAAEEAEAAGAGMEPTLQAAVGAMSGSGIDVEVRHTEAIRGNQRQSEAISGIDVEVRHAEARRGGVSVGGGGGGERGRVLSDVFDGLVGGGKRAERGGGGEGGESGESGEGGDGGEGGGKRLKLRVADKLVMNRLSMKVSAADCT